MRLPVLFTGHGSPIIALEDNVLTKNFSQVGDYIINKYGKPKAILSIGAHWFVDKNLVQKKENPRQVYDMYGFPKELYEVKYEVKGDKNLSDRVLDLLDEDDISVNNEWGIDHGTWTVLVHMFPEADIPVVQLSVNYRLSPQEVFEIGEKLISLRDEGVLIFATGNVVHNLRELDWHSGVGTKEADSFDEYICNSIKEKKYGNVINYKEFEGYKFSVPMYDHYYPLVYALGASDADDVKVFNYTRMMGTISMTSYLWE